MTASALRAQRTRTIGAILPTLDNLIYAKATHALQKALDERGYLLLLGCHEFDLGNEFKVARSLIGRGVDGMVLIGAEHDDALFALFADLDMRRTALRGKRHLHRDVLFFLRGGVKTDAVDQSEIDDVDRNFRVVTLFQGAHNFVFGESGHGFSSGRALPGAGGVFVSLAQSLSLHFRRGSCSA